MPTVALIDYGSGNLASAAKALARAADGKFEIITTADPQVVLDAERVVLPGVGAFADCMKGLAAVPGMIQALRETGRRPNFNVEVSFTADEETDSTLGSGWVPGHGPSGQISPRSVQGENDPRPRTIA